MPIRLPAICDYHQTRSPLEKGLHVWGLSHMGFHSAAASCASSMHSILRLWRGPSPRAYARGIISHGLSCRCDELCLFEALYPAPLAQPFSKGLLAWDYLTRTFMPLRRVVPLRGTPSCAFGAALLQGPARGDYLTWAFMPLRRIVPLRSTLSRALVRPFSNGLRAGGIFYSLVTLSSSVSATV